MCVCGLWVGGSGLLYEADERRSPWWLDDQDGLDIPHNQTACTKLIPSALADTPESVSSCLFLKRSSPVWRHSQTLAVPFCPTRHRRFRSLFGFFCLSFEAPALFFVKRGPLPTDLLHIIISVWESRHSSRRLDVHLSSAAALSLGDVSLLLLELGKKKDKSGLNGAMKTQCREAGWLM